MQSTIQNYCELLASKLKEAAIEEKRPQMEAYMKHIAPFFGVPSPQRKEILKIFLSEHPLQNQETADQVVRYLFDMPQRELHYCAMDILSKSLKLFNPQQALALTKHCITTHSWWDTVDLLASNILGKILQKNPELIIEVNTTWMESGNMWLQRSCLLFQLKYKKATDTQLLQQNIEYLMFEKEFFIRKAIGWVLREYAKTHPKWVLNFVKTHDELSTLSKKEALKYIE